MDDLFDLIEAFTYWRMLFATALAVALATTLAHFIDHFPVPAWVGIICAGTVLGVLWHKQSR